MISNVSDAYVNMQVHRPPTTQTPEHKEYRVRVERGHAVFAEPLMGFHVNFFTMIYKTWMGVDFAASVQAAPGP
jgi:hypothetical protein